MTTTSSTPIPASPTSVAPILAIFNLVVRYGNIEALHGVSLQIFPGQIVSLIGANGAGKSSLLRAISGLIPTHSGTILYAPHNSPTPTQPSIGWETPPQPAARPAPLDLARTPPHRIVSLGISHVPEGRGIFLNMSVQENLELGAYLRHDHHAVVEDLHRVYTLFPRIKERRTQLAATMSGGEQQMLAIGRALMARPRVLLLDEPSLGLAPLLVEQIFTVIRDINQTAGGGGEGGEGGEGGVTILLVEQNAHLALQIAHYAYVLETGTISLQGPAPQIRGNDQVRKAYLGED
jgi:branched-chain amino acid transport system ATP-binding protein